MKKKLKIAMLCKSLPWSFKGGIQTHSWTLSKELCDLGHEVTIIAAGSFMRGSEYIKEGIKVIEIPYFPGRYIFPIALLAEEFFFNLALKNWIRKNNHNYDIIHMQGRTGYLGASVKGRTPIVQTIHGLLDHELVYSDEQIGSKIYRFFTRPFELNQIRSADRILTVNNELMQSVLSNRWKCEERVKVIPNGLRFDSAGKLIKNRQAITFVGRLTKIKNVEFLIELMNHLPWDISLNIIGSGPLKDRLQQMTRKKGLHSRINFHGDLQRYEINEVLKYSLALVLPSYHETQGIVLLEAAANSIPSIASDIPAIRECVVDKSTGFLCGINDLQAYKSAVLKFYNDPTLSIEMGKKARAFAAKKFDLRKISRATINAYYETIAA